MRWVLSAVAGVVLGLMMFAVGTTNAQPAVPTPTPPGPATSTSDELADMVMEVIENGAPAAPTTTPVAAPRP